MSCCMLITVLMSETIDVFKSVHKIEGFFESKDLNNSQGNGQWQHHKEWPV